MSRKQKKRQEIFRRFAANWNNMKHAVNLTVSSSEEAEPMPPPNDLYVCPLCLNFFTHEALTIPDMLTLEHVPPHSVSGKIKCLTCKTCNTKAGSELDSHLIKAYNFHDILTGVVGTSSDVRMSLNNSPFISATLTIPHTDSREIVPHPHRSSPEYLAQFNEKLSKIDPDSFDLKFDLGNYLPMNAKISILRSAYLWGFSTLGHSFLLNYSLDNIRAQIRDPSKIYLRNWLISPPGNLPEQYLGVNIIIRPENLRSYLVFLKIRNNIFGIVLPSPLYPGEEVYTNLELNPNPRISIVKVPDNIDFVYFPAVALDIWLQVENI